jgi:hypothetical protein
MGGRGNREVTDMTREQTLDLLMLLSALESWSFSTGKLIPDYLHDRLAATVELLSGEILNGK